jgi:flagellar hook-length control protein FliK
MSEGRQGRTMGPAVSMMAKHTEQKQPAVAGGSPAGSNPAVGASAPAPVSSLTAGVAQGIAGALDSARAAATTARFDSATDGAPPEAVRTIALNLDMREYGQVDLRISLRGSTVSVHLKAERQETADALARDDSSLRQALHRAGYEAGQVQVDKRDAAGPRLGDAAASGQQQAGGAGSGASSGQMAGDQRAATPDQRPQAQRGGDAFALHEQDTQDVPRQDRYRDPDRLYV